MWGCGNKPSEKLPADEEGIDVFQGVYGFLHTYFVKSTGFNHVGVIVLLKGG